MTHGSILFHAQIAWKFPKINIGASCNERAGEEARASVTFILHQGSLFCIASQFAFVSQVFHTTLQPPPSPESAKAHSSAIHSPVKRWEIWSNWLGLELNEGNYMRSPRVLASTRETRAIEVNSRETRSTKFTSRYRFNSRYSSRCRFIQHVGCITV